MTRPINPETLAKLESSNVALLPMLYLDYVTTPVAVHAGAGFDIVYDGNTFRGVGQYGGISRVDETSELQVNGVDLTLSGVDTALISIALDPTEYTGRGATLYIAVIDDSYQLVGEPIIIFKGQIDRQVIDAGSTATIKLSVENRLAIFNKPTSLRHNDEVQQRRYPGDLGFQYAEQAKSGEIIWGQPD